MGKLSFGATGLSYQVDPVKFKTTGAPDCPRCGTRVYFMEQVLANGKSWHKKCFTCVSCKKPLDSTSCCAHEDEIYCKMCHKREFGPKGYGFAGGAAGLSTESAFSKKSQKTSPPRTVEAHPAHIPAPSGENRDRCPRCAKNVYQAEEVKANGRSWHRLCFKCGECNKMLERGRCNEHEGDLFCNSCYNRKFGIKGYGYAGGNGSLLSSGAVVRNSPPKRHESAGQASPQTNGSPTGHGSPQTNGSPAGHGSPQTNGSPAGHGSPPTNGSPAGHGSPQTNGSPAGHGSPQTNGSPVRHYSSPEGPSSTIYTSRPIKMTGSPQMADQDRVVV